MSKITVNSIKKSNVIELKFELNKRGISTHGKKRELSKWLIGVIEGNSSQEDNAKNVNTLLSKENIKCMKKEILNEEFTKQEENITKLINGNFRTTIAELKKSQDDFNYYKFCILKLKGKINGNKLKNLLTFNFSFIWYLGKICK